MKKLIVFSFGANVEESRLLTKMTELFFVKLIGDRNLLSINDMGKDFKREEGWSWAESLAYKDQEHNGDLAFAVVCEYPTRNILEWYESVRDTFGATRTRLYIRITDTMTIHPLIYSYSNILVPAKEILADPNKYGTEQLSPNMFARKNSFGEYELAIPKVIDIESEDEVEFARAKDVIENIAKLLQIDMKINYIEAIDKNLLDEDEELRNAD